ncbi:MAG: TonB-dependent receptor [Bacteroidetes bacterium]|nr:TonB-dependent receptor [Bacteroidota bacterium]
MKSVLKNSLVPIVILLSFFISSAQEVRIEAYQTPLNKVLIGIIDSDDINISFDDKSLSLFLITKKYTYPTIEKALGGLLTGLPFNYELIDGVWVIYPEIVEVKKTRTKLYISGRVSDKISNEALPYSHVIINGWPSVTDLKGGFSTIFPSEDSLIHVQVSYLGYYVLDTLVSTNRFHDFALIPSSIGLSEVVIVGSKVEKSTQIGVQPGLMKLNHKIAHFLPGYGDNSVLNLIRLMPGILASGEQTSELIIWGSYAGQSKVMFDGYTVYGLKNFNDNISAFNPFLAKDIEIHKGGYDALFGERVGGIVNIVGKNGNTVSPSFTVSLNNMTLNGMVEIPIFKKGSLIIAYRHTYYNLYNPSDMTSLVKRNNDADTTNDVDITIIPDYRFRDLNIKYSTTFNNNDLFYISLHGGFDNFSYSIDDTLVKSILDKKTSEETTQFGGSIYYGNTLKNGNTNNFRLSYSGLNSFYQNDFKQVFPLSNNTEYLADDTIHSKLGELCLEYSNIITINRIHSLESGINLYNNEVKLVEYSFNALTAKHYESSGRISIYSQDNISIRKNINLKVGFRLNYAPILKKVYFEPRVSASIEPHKNWKINVAFGLYSQFVSLSTIVDEYGNYRYMWVIADNDEVPVLNATHYVLGTSFHNNDFTFSIEGYYKNTTGLTRYINRINANIQDIFHGKAESYGIDILIKKDVLKHSAWIAYSISRTLEHFSYFKKEDTRRAPHDQLHELKLAAMLNFDPIFFSTNYVFGSGFPDNSNSTQSNNSIYSRLDVSLIYKFLNRKVNGEIGFSILNVLNTKNLKYSSFEKIPGNQTNGINILTEAIPFTPTLHLKISM